MHTPDNKTAAAESAKRCDEDTGDLTPFQFTDLVCYILSCAENQTQPEYFTLPESAESFSMTNETDNSSVTVWTVKGWPLAIQDNTGQFICVLSGEPASKKPELRLIVPDENRMRYIPELFFTPMGESMVMDWLTRHSDYEGGNWNYFVIPEGSDGEISLHTTVRLKTTGYIAPDFDGTYKICVPGNYFEGEVSADAAGIIATLMILNSLSWKASAMGEKYARTCQLLVERQDALKDYISIIKHPEALLIFRAID
ncbi:antirestriction protein [Enterobacter quasiroggenkampii]|uniref:antirestriction protein n=1 Tax=Enterobacter quasiroggenkampii TaxID=2497436 RepID=UPI0020043B1F|nr:antirestriction protein [Enterobacter quasiroggenkampii]MCK7310544.1 antirestriction protein [Enterobacter quasiroggenkampii]